MRLWTWKLVSAGMRAELLLVLFDDVTLSLDNGVTYMVPERLASALFALNRKTKQQNSTRLGWGCGGGYLRDEQPSGLLGHPQAHGQTDDQVQDQQQQEAQPSTRREGGRRNINPDESLSPA